MLFLLVKMIINKVIAPNRIGNSQTYRNKGMVLKIGFGIFVFCFHIIIC